MAQNTSALVKDPALLAEAAEICDRIRADLLHCIDDCQNSVARTHDRGFQRALNSVAESCRAGIQALEKHLDSGTGMEPEATARPLPRTPKKDAASSRVIHGEKEEQNDWRPGDQCPWEDQTS